MHKATQSSFSGQIQPKGIREGSLFFIFTIKGWSKGCGLRIDEQKKGVKNITDILKDKKW